MSQRSFARIRPALFLAAALCALPAAHAELPTVVAEHMARVKLPEDALAALVLRIDDGTVLVSHQPDRAMQTASTMKLVTTAAGLAKLGPIYRARTTLLTNGEIKGDILWGDVILRGGGDTELTPAALQDMLQTLRHKGVRYIRGDLVLDRSLYQPARMDVGVAPFDESPEARYNLIPDALLLNQNLQKLEISSDGENIRVSIWPTMEKVRVANDMTLADRPCTAWEDGWKVPTVNKNWNGDIRITLHGSFPRNCSRVTELNLLDRTDYADRLFRTQWKQLGGSIKGRAREGTAPEKTLQLAEHVARPLAEVIRDINKPSDNAFTRILFLTLGTVGVENVLTAKTVPLPAEPADTAVRAERVVREWVASLGVSTDGLVLENGSGLSRTERVSPAQMAAVLKAAHQSLWAPEFKASLPLVGMDGTMRRRLKDSPAAGHARMKTGTLRNVTANAGYVLDGKGREYIVVGLVNSDTMKAADGRGVLDTLIDWVARIDAPVVTVQAAPQ